MSGHPVLNRVLICFIILQKTEEISNGKAEWNERTELCLLKVGISKSFFLLDVYQAFLI